MPDIAQPHNQKSIRCLFNPAIGGTGLESTESLMRFIGNSVELTHLLCGRLSLPRADSFTDNDPNEARITKADRIWSEKFYGHQSGYKLLELEKKRSLRLKNVFISCWHRFASNSDLERLDREYLNEDFKCVVQTKVEYVLRSVFEPDRSPYFLDFLPIRYLNMNETKTSRDELSDESPRCISPLFEFKRDHFKYEREARFVLTDGTTEDLKFGMPGFSMPHSAAKYQYFGVKQHSLISHIFSLNDDTHQLVKSLLQKHDVDDRKHTRCNISELKLKVEKDLLIERTKR